MIDDYEAWRKTTDDRLWLAGEETMTQAEAHRYFEAGLHPVVAEARILADRDAASLLPPR